MEISLIQVNSKQILYQTTIYHVPQGYFAPQQSLNLHNLGVGCAAGGQQPQLARHPTLRQLVAGSCPWQLCAFHPS